MDSERGMIRAAGSMSVITMLSRIAGYVRDNLQATLLGAADSSDAFVIAFRIPNMLRRLLGEGALTSAFVPTFTRYMKSGDRQATWRFAGSVFYALAALLVAVVALGVVFSPLLVRALAWGFSDEAARFALAVILNRLMFPYIFFIALAALAGAILNAFGVFALPASTPIVLNLAIIGAALSLSHRLPDPSYGFAAGVLLGGVLQLVIQIPALRRQGFSLRPPRLLDFSGLREVGRLMLPRVFGVGITQINLVVDSQFATALGVGSVSFLYYAIRVEELTLGVFAISLSTVVLPALSRAAADGDGARVKETLGTALRLLMFVTLPAATGLILLRVPIIHVLFERGRFSAEDTVLTAGALAFYALGLPAYAAVQILATAFYAHRDTRTPVLVATLTFFVHVGLNFALSGPLRHRGIALSTALSAALDAILLGWLLRRHAGAYLTRAVGLAAARAAAAAALMGGALAAVTQVVDVRAPSAIFAKAGALGGLIALGAAIFLLASWAIGSQELRLLRSVLGRRR